MATKTTTKKPAKKPVKKTTVKNAAPRAVSAAPTTRSARQRAEEQRWEATSDLDVLRRAEEVRANPSRMRAAKTESTRLQTALKNATRK